MKNTIINIIAPNIFEKKVIDLNHTPLKGELNYNIINDIIKNMEIGNVHSIVVSVDLLKREYRINTYRKISNTQIELIKSEILS